MHTGPRLQPLATVLFATLGLSAFVGAPGTLSPVTYTTAVIVAISLTIVVMRTYAKAHATHTFAPLGSDANSGRTDLRRRS